MKKRKAWVFIGIGIVSIFLVSLYLLNYSKPTSFPTHEQLVAEINSTFPEADASDIQDTISVDERHGLVPFISTTDDYGLSYWIWEKNKWKVDTIDTNGVPTVWKVDRNNPSSYRIVWNVHPEDQVSSFQFYLKNDRNYLSLGGIETYTPGVLLKKKVSLNKNSYGLMKFPEEWVTFMNTSRKVESAKQPNMFFNDFSPNQGISYHWISYDQDGNETFLDRSMNGIGSYSNGKIEMEFILNVNKGHIEDPSLH
ncbi:hypothetical protein WAK64_16050 [Bacillus spongiae]|uniref:Uncharacterized protein n=1 Tax=Bacillus spongiae TaxID=2683610 RepID=A0ABU8HGQ3_9BACI